MKHAEVAVIVLRHGVRLVALVWTVHDDGPDSEPPDRLEVVQRVVPERSQFDRPPWGSPDVLPLGDFTGQKLKCTL